jgi:recombinational DNA repair ATPase RecF
MYFTSIGYGDVMNLLTLQIFPKGLDGWMSDELHFGNHITQLFGPNGCGKTPLNNCA